MDEDDYAMGEGPILKSTEPEVNGNHVSGTIDPSMLALDGNHITPFASRSKKLPILGYDDSEQTEMDHPSFSPLRRPPPSIGTSTMTSDSDEMDITYPVRQLVEVRIPPAPRYVPLPYPTKRTGLVYDARMRFHCEPSTLMLGEDDIHPEDPRRIHEIFEEIQQAGLVQGPGEDEDDANDAQCWRIHPRSATKGEICLIHTPDHYDFIESLEHKSEDELKDLSDLRDSIYFHNSTFECATLAAGGAIEACRAVVRGDVRNAIAIIRPPGHHAECDQPSGFCIFNNVPIATRVCQNDFPEQCRKVMILDWDVHHGNGIQHAFYEDPNVLYISLHVYKNKGFYPFLPDANLDFTGDGAGKGKNVNIPWPDQGMGDAEYIYAFQQVVIPIATEFDPDLVIISAGFDAAEGDMLGGCHVTPACYSHMTHMLMGLAKGKVAVCLEGGYNLRSIARSALAVTRTLMLEPPERLAEDLGSPREDAVRLIERIRREQSKYWKCMLPKEPDREDPTAFATRRLHDIIREWQSGVLLDAHSMSPLTIHKSEISQTFKHNVLATPRFMEEHPLLVIFHDPPDVMNRPDPVNGSVDLHNIWLTDVTKAYIDWAIEEGFQVIDVNIPQVISIEDEDGGWIQSDSHEARQQQTRVLAEYLWENYIEPFDATQIFLMGIGAPYHGLVDLLGANESTTEGKRPIECLIGFISETSIHSIRRATDDYIPQWFYDHTEVFVASHHHVWAPSRQRKLRRKWGKLIQSPHRSLADMLEHHQKDVQNLLLEKKNEYDERHPKPKPSISTLRRDNERRNADLDEQREYQQSRAGLRSPPLNHSGHGGRRENGNGHGSGNGNGGGRGARASGSTTPRVKSPKLPQMGLFAVSPRSPMKKF